LVKFLGTETSARLQFEHDRASDQKIRLVRPNLNSVTNNWNPRLFDERDPLLRQLQRNGPLIHRLNLPAADLVVNLETTPNDLIAKFRQNDIMANKPHIRILRIDS